MTHNYLKQLGPEMKIAQCDQPAAFAKAEGSRVVIQCAAGHLIRGHLMGSERKAKAYAARLQKKLQPKPEPKTRPRWLA